MICSESSCNRVARYSSTGLCVPHYQQHKSGKPLMPIQHRRPQGACRIRDERGRKQCIDCGEWLAESNFAAHPKSLDKLNVHCQACKARKRRASNYQMTADQIDELITSQGSRCAICRGTSTGDHRGWRIDHDHACCPGPQSCGRCVRGALCSPCNLAIGLFRDDPSILRAAAAYLESHVEVCATW